MLSKDTFKCKCCGVNKIEDKVVTICNDIEKSVGTITVTSGYRCKNHNAKVGGKENSQHLQGNAADITCADVPKLVQACKKLWSDKKIGGLGIYNARNFCHVDIGSHRSWEG